MSQVRELADQVITAVKSYVGQSVAAITARLDDLDGRVKAIPAPLKGDRGDPGNDAEVTDEQLIGIVKTYFLENPIPVPQDGKSVAPEDVLPTLEQKLVEAVNALPRPLDGKDGLSAFDVAVALGFEGTVHDWMDSLRGEPGEDGKSVTVDEVLPALEVKLQEAIEAIPLPKDGKDGEPGKDGKSVTVEDFRTMFEAECSKALLDFERRAQDVLQKAVDRMPKPKDGIDGLGFDDLEVLHDGERQVTLKFSRGEVVKEFPITIPALIDRGVYRQGQSYAKGDCVSYGGSTWIAQKGTDTKPESDDSWRLAVKRGRDGKDGKSIKGEKGDPGRPGRDLTQMGHDGAKW